MNGPEEARERWARIIAQQRESGETVAGFCAARGIAVSSFYPWKRRLLGGADAVGAAAAEAFVEAVVRAVPVEHGGITIELPGGRRVAVTRGFDRVLLEVIAVLESGGAGDGVPGERS